MSNIRYPHCSVQNNMYTCKSAIQLSACVARRMILIAASMALWSFSPAMGIYGICGVIAFIIAYLISSAEHLTTRQLYKLRVWSICKTTYLCQHRRLNGVGWTTNPHKYAWLGIFGYVYGLDVWVYEFYQVVKFINFTINKS